LAAINVLSGGFIRPGFPIEVVPASFPSVNTSTEREERGEEEPAVVGSGSSSSKRPRPAPIPTAVPLSEARVRVVRAAAAQALSWSDDPTLGRGTKHALRVVVLENMFHPSDFSPGPDCDPSTSSSTSISTGSSFVDELESDIASGCEVYGGLEKITVFSQHPDGIVSVKFVHALDAQACVKGMNGRVYNGRRLKVYYWDHDTDFTAVKVKVGVKVGIHRDLSDPGSAGVGYGGGDVEEEEEWRLRRWKEEVEQEQLDLPAELQPRVQGQE